MYALHAAYCQSVQCCWSSGLHCLHTLARTPSTQIKKILAACMNQTYAGCYDALAEGQDSGGKVSTGSPQQMSSHATSVRNADSNI